MCILNKVVMKSDKVLERINKLKSIIQSLNDRIPELNNADEINRNQERLNFINCQMKEQEKQYQALLQNDSPYYANGTLDYYTDIFKEFDFSKLESSFVNEVVYCVENELMKNKLNAIKNIVKAYQVRNFEIMGEFRNRSNKLDR